MSTGRPPAVREQAWLSSYLPGNSANVTLLSDTPAKSGIKLGHGLNNLVQGGPLPVVSGVISPINCLIIG